MIKNAVKQICSMQGRQLYELANDLNITRQTLHRFLTGAPTLATVEKIANALQVPPFILLHPAPLAALREWNSHQDHTGPAASVHAVCPVCRSPLKIQITQDTTQPATDETGQKETTQDQKPRGRKHKRQDNEQQNEMELF